MFCHEQVAQLRDARPKIEAKGGRLKIVGNGTSAMAEAFAAPYGMMDTVFTDPQRNVYRALGMVHGVGKTIGAGSLKNGLRAFSKGFRQEKVQGDPWQQGGTVVVTGDGRIVYRYLSKAAGDHAPLSEILSVLERETTVPESEAT